MSTDYRALCAELIDALDSGIPTERMVQSPLITRARAALSQPESVGPTDEEIIGKIRDSGVSGVLISDVLLIARAVLARWGRLAITPILASERLPGTEDVESKVRYCWWYNYEDQAWYYCDAAHCDLNVWTHWLPYYALPLPAMASCG